MITPKAVISLSIVSRDIIPFDINVVAVGTTSDNISSKRKTLDEVSLSLSKSKT